MATSSLGPYSTVNRRIAALLRDVVAEQRVEAVLERVVITLHELIPCRDVVVWEVVDGVDLTVAFAVGDNAVHLRELRIRIGEGLTGTAALEGRPLVCNDAHRDPRAGLVPGTERVPEAVACMPLIAHGSLLGVLGLYRRDPRRRFDADEVELVEDFAAVAALVLENAKARAELELLAITDDLTGLPNRRHFRIELERELAAARRYRSKLSLLLLDLDDFKSINDRWGHECGDQALEAVAEAIRQRVRAPDLAARIGGDEFAVLLPHTGRRGAATLAGALEQGIRRALQHPLSTGVSIGVSTLGSQPGDDDLFAEADRFLYQAKRDHPDPGSRRLAASA